MMRLSQTFTTTAMVMMTTLALIATGCAKEPKVSVKNGEDSKLYNKAELLVGETSPKEFTGKNKILVERAIEEKIELVEFTLTKSFLTLWKGPAKEGKALLQFDIAGHYDLVRDQNASGKETQYLIKKQITEKAWSEHAFVEVDALDLKLVVPDEKLLVILYKVNDIKSKTYTWGETTIPGIDGRSASDFAAKQGLKKGQKIRLVLLKDEVSYEVERDGKWQKVATSKAAYVDLVRVKNEDGELTNEFEQSSTEKAWDKREYVSIDSTDTASLSSDDSLISKASLEGCSAIANIADQSIKTWLLSQREVKLDGKNEVCIDTNQQTILSICRKGNGDCANHENLIATFPIKSHVELETRERDDSQARKTNLWYERPYVLIASTKGQLAERPVDVDAIKKSDLKGEFIYTATVVGAHSENGSFFDGLVMTTDSRLKFEFSQDAITAYKTNDLLNTSNTPTPVLRFGADHLDIERSRTKIGEKTSVIEVARRLPWNQRSMTHVSFGSNQISGYWNNFLGRNNLYSGSFVVAESALKTKPTVEKDGTVWYETEEVLTPNAKAGNFGAGETELEPVSIVIRHSFVKVGESDYVAKEYDRFDFRRFGLFRSTKLGLDKDQRATDDTKKDYARLYDISEGKQIVFSMNDEFPAKYHDEMENVVKAWNKAFEAATGRKNVVVLSKEKGNHFGDPRKSMLVYFPHRNISSPLGYGPTIADPETGLVLSGKSYLYGDAVRSVTKAAGDYYDLLSGDKPLEEFANEGLSTPIGRSVTAGETTVREIDEDRVRDIGRGGIGNMTNVKSLARRVANAGKTVPSPLQNKDILGTLSGLRSDLDFSLENKGQKALKHDHNHGCLLSADEFLASAANFVKVFKESGMPKAEILAIVESNVVFTTMLHEVGHNFGLRHNFYGSFDEANFHPGYFKLKKKIAEATGPEPVETVSDYLEMYKTSSIMEYNNMFEATELAAGAYDVAAIKYAYGDIMEVIDVEASKKAGHMVSKDLAKSTYLAKLTELQEANKTTPRLTLENSLDQSMGIRPYKFCTDDHVSNDPTCNRHDSGTTVSEIVENMISAYDVRYVMSGFRRGRRDFSGASSTLNRYILPVRQIFDEWVYHLISGGMPETGPGSSDDYLQAINTGIQFFIKILSDVEPGYYVQNEETKKYEASPTPPKAGQKGFNIDLSMGKYLSAAYETIGSDQRIVRRGTELDKLYALLGLSLRGFPADKYMRAGLSVGYYDLIRKPILELFSNIMRDELKTNITVAKVGDRMIPVPAELASQLAGNPAITIERIELKASSSSAIKAYAKIFAFDSFESPADYTLSDYIDFRVEGVGSTTFPSDIKTISFTSALGNNTYVIPQTRDGMSISYATALKAPEASAKLEAAIKALADPEIKADLQEIADGIFEKMLVSFDKIRKELGLDPTPEETKKTWGEDKIAGVTAISEQLDSWTTQIAALIKQTEAAGAVEQMKEFQALMDLLVAESKTYLCDSEAAAPAPVAPGEEESDVACSIEGFKGISKSLKVFEEQQEELTRELRGIETDLLELKRYYDLINN